MEKNRILELALGGIYFLSGFSKLLPIPSMVEQFDQFAEHFPFGVKVSGWLLLKSVGVSELIGGFCLLQKGCSRVVKTIAASSMMVIMVGAWHSLYSIGEDPAMFAPSIVCFGALAYLLATNHWDEKPKGE